MYLCVSLRLMCRRMRPVDGMTAMIDGKADTTRAGILVARHPLRCCVQTLIYRHALSAARQSAGDNQIVTSLAMNFDQSTMTIVISG
jgi:hypothetical protein